jgi:hypothetical protein
MDPDVTGQTGQADEDSQPREKRDWGFADLDDACSKVPLRVEGTWKTSAPRQSGSTSPFPGAQFDPPMS